MLGGLVTAPMKGVGLFVAVGVYAIVKSGDISTVPSVGRYEAVQKFRLTEIEANVYDSCRSNMSRQVLRSGGDMGYFCGCFAKTATSDLNPAHKQKAVTYFTAYLAKDGNPGPADRFFPYESHRGHVGTSQQAADSVMSGTSTCVDEANDERKAARRSAKAR